MTMNLRADPAAAVNDRAIILFDAEPADATGTVEVLPDGYGALRRADNNFLPAPTDIHVPAALVRRHRLRTGMTVTGPLMLRPAEAPGPALLSVDAIDGLGPARRADCAPFAELRPVHPHRRLMLSDEAADLGPRVVDLVTPIGKGQRGLIVAPPRTGKTVLLAAAARALRRNHPECHLVVLLIDERPEEVTELRRTIAGPGAEVIASTFDRPPGEHLHVATMALERSKRLCEAGRDVVILHDSLTRLARASNNLAPAGKLMSGGIVAGALDWPKRFFGAARATEDGGSLTILATALIDTGSRMDEVIFEEFKGTGNMELHLDRRLVDRRVWPAIDINRSGTRKEELLLGPEELAGIAALRKVVSGMQPVEAMAWLTGRLAKTRSNAEFLALHTGARGPASHMSFKYS
jgi:transcription termination factor Rho